MVFQDHDWLQRFRITTDQLLTKLRREVASDAATVRLGKLEPRLLFSATPIDPALAEPAFVDSQEDAAMVMSVVSEDIQDGAVASTVAGPTSQATDLIIIDSLVPNLQELLDDLNRSRPDASVFILDGNRDGVQQITEILDSHSGLASIHIVSHAEDSAVRLGDAWLGPDNVNAYAGQLAQWQSALSVDADILFYGCDLASESSGREFLESLAALTGADVAASDDDTGHSRYGGDWDLEFTVGMIDSPIAVSESFQESWLGKLAIIQVDTFDDEDNSNATTSLREAVEQANSGDTILLGVGTYEIRFGLIQINEDIRIEGAGAGSTTIARTQNNGRIFETNNTAVVSISGVTIQGGEENNGGGIFVNNDSVLYLSDAVLQDNTSNKGGAIHVHGTAHLNRVLLFNNTSTNDGGAISFHGSNGGSLTNVTISGNTTAGLGGGLWTDSDVTITNSTITNNAAADGGGIYEDDADVEIANSIVVNNSASTTNDDVFGVYISNGHNIIEVIGSATGLAGDIIGDDAGLLALADNGGPFATHAITSTSAALNSGLALGGFTNPGGITTDARGYQRDSQTDIGAFELGWTPELWLTTSNDVASPSGVNGLNAWDKSEIIGLGDPNLSLGSGGTNGTLASKFDLNAFADDGSANMNGFHFVSRNMTIGGANAIELRQGDLLFTTGSESFHSGAVNVSNKDVVLFRPDTVGDYSSGTFSIVLDEMASGNLYAITLVEKTTILGDVILEAGDFLYSNVVTFIANDIYWYQTSDVGDGTTDGVRVKLIDGDDLGISSWTGDIQGIDLIETRITIGGQTLESGTLLVNVTGTQDDVGANGITTTEDDIIAFDLSTTTHGSGTAAGTASILMKASDIGLDSTPGRPNGFSLAYSMPATAAPNVAPTAISLSTTSIDENVNTSGGLSIGSFTTTDADTTETFTYEIVGGVDAALFTIGGANNDELRIDDGLLDHERRSSYQVEVRVRDSASNSLTSVFTIMVNDLNDVAPVITANQVFSVSESAANATVIGTVVATDLDSPGSLTNWTITGGNSEGVFAIDASTGMLRIADNSTLDFENQTTYTLSVRVGDGVSQSSNETIQINVVNVSEVNAVWFSTSSDVSNSGNPDLAAWDQDQIIQLTDPNLNFDPNGGTTSGLLGTTGFKISNFNSGPSARIEGIHAVWSDLTVGTGANQFELRAGDLILTLASDNVTLNSETEPDRTFDKNDVFVFRPTTEGDYTAGNFYHLLDDPLNAGRIRGVSLVENAGGVQVGDTTLAQGTFLLVRDGANEEDRVYTFQADTIGLGSTSGTSQILLEGSGTAETADGGNLGFSERIDAVHIVASDRVIGGTTLLAGDLLLSTYQVNSIAGTAVEDQDVVRLRMTTTRIGGTHSTGSAVVFLDASDIQMQPGSSSEDIDAVTLVEGALANRAVGPIADTNTAANGILETATPGTSVGITAFATDPDTGDTVTYTLDDDASGRFQINTVSGQVTLNDDLNYEAASSHQITVRATSSDTSFRTLAFTIAVLDVNEAPTLELSTDALTLAENTNTSTSITVATLTVNDDALGTEVITLSGADHQKFEVIGNTLRLRANTVLDFETQSTLEVIVSIDDNTVGATPDDSQRFELTITNANDAATGAPVIQGDFVVGQTLSVDTSLIADEDGLGAFNYQWLRGGTEITDAVDSVYTLRPEDVGETIQVEVRFIDGQSNQEGPLTSIATTTVARFNTAPTLNDHQMNAVSGQEIFVPKLVFESLATDPEGDELTAVLVTPPEHGTLNLAANGRFLYKAEDGFIGQVTFQWMASDGSLMSNVATVTINVRPPRILVPNPPTDSPTNPGGESTNTGDSDNSTNSSDNDDTSSENSDTSSSSDETSEAADQATSPIAKINGGESTDGTSTAQTGASGELSLAQPSGTSTNEKTASDQTDIVASSSASNTADASDRSNRSTRTNSMLESTNITRIDNEGAALAWEDMVALTRPGVMWDDLDDRRDQVESQIQGDLIVVGSAGAAASSMTVGVLAWAMRSGFLVSGLIAHMPAWSGVDPLMIMQGVSADGRGADQETLEELMDRQSKAIDSEETAV
ncbi:Cadherin domain protein [Neorhodopirellula pilleata]|uniref:Cadherin domain protein n=2 Tax=Neorhodopirellula pilleata TaxID=2714738 RepID=A0A5C6B098_9BACT|nr:Cadherin domain protein [Neorhodopirellula pilleata]